MADQKKSALFQWIQQQQGDMERLRALATLFTLVLIDNAPIRASVLSHIDDLLGEDGGVGLGETTRTTLENVRELIETLYGST